MIFSSDLVYFVLSGRKTVTRRRQVHRGGRPLRYRQGGVYAVQSGRGQAHVGHIRVRAIAPEPLGSISHNEARREGFTGKASFFQRWGEMHGGVDPDEIVVWISFERAPDCAECLRGFMRWWYRSGHHVAALAALTAPTAGG